MARHSTHDIESRLAQVRARIRRMQRLRGLMLSGATLLLGLLVAMAIDLIFAPVPLVVRWVVFVAWVAALVWILKVGFGPLFQRIDLVRIARWLEQRHPEIEERLSTALELANDQSVSPDLMEALVEAADRDVGTVDPAVEVAPGRGVRRWRRVVVVCGLILAAALVIQPGATTRLLIRAVAPFSDVGNAGAVAFGIAPEGLEVLEGDAIEIRVRHEVEPQLVLEMDSGDMLSQPMVREDDAWVYRLEPAREGFRYRARADRAESDAYEARVWPYPRLRSVEATLRFPDYTGLAPLQATVEKRIEQVAGTKVELSAALNTPVESAWLQMPDGRKVEGRVEDAATGPRLVFDWELQHADNGEVVMGVHHRLGRDIEMMRFEQNALGDQAPVVVLLEPEKRELRVRASERLDLSYEVTEDFGLAKVAVEVDAGDKGRFTLDQTLPAKVEELAGFPRYRGRAELVIGEVIERIGGSRRFRFRVGAEDSRPQEVGGPGRGFSEWVEVEVRREAESLARQKLRSEHEDALKTLEKAMHDTRVAQEKMHQNRQHLVPDEKNEWSEKLSEETVEKLAGAEQAMEELAERIEQGIHAAQTDKVEQAAGQLEQARDAFEEVALQDDPQQRSEKLDEALQASKEALKTMEEVRREIEKARPQVEDLARIEELAQEQEELARQAGEMAANENEVGDEWRREQQQVEDELRGELRERPEALAEALRDQAEAARELSQDARELAEDQQRLEEIAAGQAEAPSAAELREALAEAQKQLAQEAREQADQAEDQGSETAESAEQAAGRTEQAAEKMAAEEASKEADRQAADAAREAAEQLGEAAEQADAERQQLADASGSSGEETAQKESAAEPGSEAGSEQASTGENPGSENGEPSEPAQAGSGEPTAKPSTEQAAERAGAMADLAERQDQLADAAEALAKGDLAEASQALEEAGGLPDDALAEALGEMLAEEQAGIAKAAGEQLESARQAGSGMAESLPEAAEATGEAAESLAEGAPGEASQPARQAGEALAEAAAESLDLAQSQMADSPAKAIESAVAGAALAELGARQQTLNQALEALESGDLSAALGQVQEMQAAQAGELARELAALPSPQGNALMGAPQQAERGSQQAAQAAQQSVAGQMARAAQSHGQSAQSLERAAEMLEQGAAQFAQQAANLGQRDPRSFKAPVGAEALADAFQQASQAAEATQTAQAAQQAAQAARALAQSAQQARAQMQGQPMPGPPGQPGPPSLANQPSPPGGKPSEGVPMPEPGPGVPAELAKLGVSAADWEKIQASLKSDVGAGGADAVPEDYRGLVKDYFERMSR